MSGNKGESWRKNEKYLTEGAKGSLHGYDYQLKLLMLFALKSKNCGIKFNLATEKVDSIKWDKFDDLIIRYEGNGEINYRFLQAKHSYSGDKIITIDDLKSDDNQNNYSLQKYFKSYLVYDRDQQYKDGDLKDFIICTNADFDLETELKDFIEIQTKKDDILNLGGKIYKFKESKKEEIIAELKPIFENALLAKPKKVKTKEPKNNTFLDDLSELAGVQVSLDDCIAKIGEFLDKLVFAVKQPDGAELVKIITKNIGFEFNLINNIIYYQFYNFMFDWMRHYEVKKNEGNKKEAHYLTNDDLKIFFDDAKEEIASLSMVSLSLLYKAKIKYYGIEFNDEIKEFQEIKNFLNSDEKQILKIIYRSKALLSGIKVCQILENHYKSHSYIFSDLKTLSILNSSAGDPITTFKRLHQNLLIIEHDCTKKEKMLTDFINVLRDHPKKKLILITTKGEIDEQLFIDKKIKCSELEDKSNKLSDLTDECQKTLLEKNCTVTFQGKDVTLSSIIEENKKYLISGEVLNMIINEEKIEVGKELEEHKYNEIEEYYIKRRFSRSVDVKEANRYEICNAIIKRFTGIDIQKPVLNPEDKRDILLTHDLSNGTSVMVQEGNEVIWQLSSTHSTIRGKDRLPIFNNEDGESFPEDSINDKQVIIVSEPGMGKSMLLTHIALQNKETDPSLLVLNIKLVDYSSELYKLKTDNNNEAFVKLLYKTFLKKYTKLTETFLNSITITIEDHKICINDNESKIDDVSWLEVQLFNELYNNGKVIFFFDGFDEICPDYKEEVIELLKVLKRSRSKIWITTRPYNISEDLENELGVFSYCLEDFSPYEQQNYLKKFWSVDDERSDIFVEGLVKHFAESTQDVLGDFLGIPLHLNMLAVVFKKEFKKWYDSGADLFSITDDIKERLNNLNYFYEEFIDIKFFQIHIKEKNSSLNTDVPSIRQMVTVQYKDQFLKDHRKLAAFSLLDESEVTLFLSKKKLNKMLKKIEDIKVGKEKTGIISHVSDNKPVFVHRTFAEYFLSHFIYDKLKTDSDSDNKLLEFLLKQILVENKYHVVCRFLNCLFADFKVDYNKSEIIKKLLKDYVGDLDGSVYVSLTPLHVASEEGLVEIIKFIVENQPDELENVPDEYFVSKKYPFLHDNLDFGYSKHWYSKIMEKKFINLRCSSYGRLNALEFAVENQREDAVRLLLENGAFVTNTSVSIAGSVNKEILKVLLDYIKGEGQIESIISEVMFPCENVMIAAFTEKYIEFLQMLIEKLDNVNIQNQDGNTPLHILAKSAKINFITLFRKGIDIECHGRETSKIISKMLDTCVQIRSYLIDHGVEYEFEVYTKPRWVKIVELLLEKGADENIINNSGKKPIDLVPDFNEMKEYFNLARFLYKE